MSFLEPHLHYKIAGGKRIKRTASHEEQPFSYFLSFWARRAQGVVAVSSGPATRLRVEEKGLVHLLSIDGTGVESGWDTWAGLLFPKGQTYLFGKLLMYVNFRGDPNRTSCSRAHQLGQTHLHWSNFCICIQYQRGGKNC